MNKVVYFLICAVLLLVYLIDKTSVKETTSINCTFSITKETK
ncbi:hypothetical protein NIES4075_72800 [Tolypothrix sp. NIES-4075]|nr:hypothetical protein NIES4075_72800 [Tolypothrix sp. NIES-4075]